MENVVDLIATDAPASEISDSIKNALFNKAAAKVEAQRPNVAMAMFDGEVESESEE